MNINLKTETLKKEIAKLINESQLPAVLALFVLQQLTQEANMLYQQCCADELRQSKEAENNG